MSTATATTQPRKRAARKVAAVPTPPVTPAPLPVVPLTSSQVIMIEELKTLKAHQRTLKARDEQLTEEIKGALRNSGGGVDEDGVLLASVADRAGRRSIDYDVLAIRYPEVYAEVVSIGNTSEVLTLHKH